MSSVIWGVRRGSDEWTRRNTPGSAARNISHLTAAALKLILQQQQQQQQQSNLNLEKKMDQEKEYQELKLKLLQD